jgi:hypothetical protein
MFCFFVWSSLYYIYILFFLIICFKSLATRGNVNYHVYVHIIFMIMIFFITDAMILKKMQQIFYLFILITIKLLYIKLYIDSYACHDDIIIIEN